MKKALLVFGGVSSEHEVSLLSAASVAENLPKDEYEAVLLGITKSGRWLLFSGSTEQIADGSWERQTDCVEPACISADRSVHGLTVSGAHGARNIYVDVAFPVLHGKNGEDGTIQGLFQLAGIPFVGCDMLSSAMSMDKAVTNTLADAAGIAQAKWLGVTRWDYHADADSFEKAVAERLGFPVFVKPANAGSSVGITKVKSLHGLHAAMETAFEHDGKAVVEEGIDGREIECAVIGNDEPQAPMVGEVVPCNEFYDYEAKYLAGESKLYIPAPIDAEKFAEVQAAAEKVYRTLGCSGLARVDFFIEKATGRLLFNELNTIPGFTSISMYSKMFGAAGIGYTELLHRLLDLAQEKWK